MASLQSITVRLGSWAVICVTDKVKSTYIQPRARPPWQPSPIKCVCTSLQVSPTVFEPGYNVTLHAYFELNKPLPRDGTLEKTIVFKIPGRVEDVIYRWKGKVERGTRIIEWRYIWSVKDYRLPPGRYSAELWAGIMIVY